MQKAMSSASFQTLSSAAQGKMHCCRRVLLAGAIAAVLPWALSGCVPLLVGGGASVATTQVVQDTRSVYTMVYDDNIEQESMKILKTNTLLSKPEDTSISITAFNGNVLITGQTVNRDYIKWVVHEIEKLEHVRKVYNYATLQKPVPASVVSNDAYITSKVKAQLLFGKDINSNRFKVVTENGNVYLMGIVTRDESRRAINTVLGISGVRKVYHIFDYIEVNDTRGNGAQADDSYVVSPVKGSKQGYYRPSRSYQYNEYQPNSTTPINRSNNSTYVPPVSEQQNGGAYIMDEPAPAQGSYSSPASLSNPGDGSGYNSGSSSSSRSSSSSNGSQYFGAPTLNDL